MTNKQCPFCGGTDLEIGHGTPDSEGTPVYVSCPDCGATGPWAYVQNVDHPEEAYDLWNTRTPCP